MSFIGSFQKRVRALRASGQAGPRGPREAFGFCFVAGGGFMTLGGADLAALRRPLCWTPFASTQRYFRVAASGVFLGARRAFLDLAKWNA